MKMKTLIIGKSLWEIVEDGYTELTDWSTLTNPAKVVMKQNQKNNSFALYHLQASMDTAIFPRIASCTSTRKKCMGCIEARFPREYSNQARLQTLKRDFENLKMKEDEHVGDYCVRVKTCVDKMKTLREDIANEVVVKKVLRSILSKWNNVTIIIEESKDLAALPYDTLIGFLMSHEDRLKELIPSNDFGDEKAFATKEGESSSSRGGSNSSRGRRQRGRERRGRFQARGGGRTSEKQCYYCNKFGHFESECRLKASHEANSGGAHYGEEENSSYLFMSIENQDESVKKETWLLDKGASNHMTEKGELFASMNNS